MYIQHGMQDSSVALINLLSRRSVTIQQASQ